MTRNKLDAGEHYSLLKWLDTPAQRVRAIINSDTNTAAEASKELGLVLTAHNINKARGILGILKRPSSKNRLSKSPPAEITDILCQRLPIHVLADMVAYTIGTDQDGDSEPASDYIYRTSKQRFGAPAWTTALAAAKARYDTGYSPRSNPV